MGTTIRDVARLARVSISTVSRVLNDSAFVEEDKRIRVAEAAQQLGYVPNPVARSLVTQETGGVGVLVPSAGGEFFSIFLNGVDHMAQQEGYYILIALSHYREDELAAAVQRMRKRVDGLMIMAPGASRASVSALLDVQMPIVFVNTHVVSDQIPSINFDNFGGGYLVTKHLIAQGHQRIATITGPLQAVDAQERLRGYRKALEEAGLPINPDLEIPGNFTQVSGYDAAKVLLKKDPRPTAIFAANDMAAIGAMSMLQQAGVRIPEEMAIAGFDDVSSARYVTPSLTTVRVPIYELGRLGIKQVLDLLHTRNTPETLRTQLPVELVVRASSG